MILDISDAEKKRMMEVGAGLTISQQQAMIQAFDERVIHNELERRTQRHLDFERDVKGVLDGYR